MFEEFIFINMGTNIYIVKTLILNYIIIKNLIMLIIVFNLSSKL